MLWAGREANTSPNEIKGAKKQTDFRISSLGLWTARDP